MWVCVSASEASKKSEMWNEHWSLEMHKVMSTSWKLIAKLVNVLLLMTNLWFSQEDLDFFWDIVFFNKILDFLILKMDQKSMQFFKFITLTQN